MAAKKVDITIFAASGSKGKGVVEEILKCDQTRDLRWAIAGRNKERLSQALDCASKETGHDVSGVPFVIAECNDQSSLDKMAKQTRVVINCIGPCIDNYRESVGKACDRNGTHHVDISKELNLSKLISIARKLVDKKVVDKALRSSGVQGKQKSPVVQTSLKKSKEKESHHPKGQSYNEHINKNLGPVERKLEFSSIYVLSYWQYVDILLVALSAFIIGYVFVTKMEKKCDISSLRTEANIKAILKPMTSKLTSQKENLWFHIFTGFMNLMQSPTSPAVFLLLSDRKSERSSFCVTKIITTVANKILPNKEGWLFLDGSELSNHKSGDSGELAEMIEENMYFSKVVVVSNIHKIPGHLAAGFHFLVDQENPKIRDAVYVFTMTIDEISGPTVPFVMNTLFKSWSNVSDDILYKLVTRLTDVVLHIGQEELVGTCPLKTDSTYELRVL